MERGAGREGRRTHFRRQGEKEGLKGQSQGTAEWEAGCPGSEPTPGGRAAELGNRPAMRAYGVISLLW